MSRTDAHVPARVLRARGVPEREIPWSRYKGHKEWLRRQAERKARRQGWTETGSTCYS
jgi:hypothetical protein